MSAAGRKVVAALSAMGVFMLGCGTMVRGTKQTVTISSEPSGASVTVDGNEAGTTPTSIKLKRHDAHVISIKKAGYLPYQTTTATSSNPAWTVVDIAPMVLFPPWFFFAFFDQGSESIVPSEVSAKLIAVNAIASPSASPSPTQTPSTASGRTDAPTATPTGSPTTADSASSHATP